MAKRSLSRRDFTKKGLIAVAALGTAGLAGYSILSSKKAITLNNYLRMGHCAPSIMQTLLDINGISNPDMVLCSGALAGGIAGPDTECGVLTAPLMFISYRNENPETIPEKIKLILKAQSYVNTFNSVNGSVFCRNIRYRGPHSCRKVVCSFYKPYSNALKDTIILSKESLESYSLVLEAFDDNNFHCAHNVLYSLENEIQLTRDLLASSWIFLGGTALLNRTCGALTAGVIALSSETAKIENSYSRVARMNRLIRNQKNEAMDDEINNFNRAISYGDELGTWFRSEFGFTSCYEIWRYDFSRPEDVEGFISGKCIKQCAGIAEKVAQKVRMMLSR